MKFFVGLHQPSDARHLPRVFLSVNRLRRRQKALGTAEWIMDSGAFTEISTHGKYRHSVDEYASEINRWAGDPAMLAAVAQDYMCEPFIIEKTGLSIEIHQRLTIERFDELLPLVYTARILPVLQGYVLNDYLRHLHMYGDRLAPGAWVGVGSICKRNSDPATIAVILSAIKAFRPDLRLHGFGLKTTALASSEIRDLLYSADSMAWSFAARKQGRNQNDWREAERFSKKVLASA